MAQQDNHFQPVPTLRLEGAPNFRDLGGYKNIQGKSLKTGRIFRSDHLGKLSAKDIQLLQRHSSQSWLVIDFRGVNERLTHPCALPHAHVLSLSIEPTVVQTLTTLLQSGVSVSSQTTVELMQDTYCNFIRQHSNRFYEFFQALAEHPESNIIFHCTAGKDRTGIAAALLLHALEVPFETIWHDYLLTNERLKHVPFFEEAPEVARVLQSVQADFLQSALDTIADEYGELDHYLEKVLGVNARMRQALAQRFLT
jgi:protein-tyrosine phosphatase